MPIDNKTRKLYDTLKGGGADVGTPQEFYDYCFPKGQPTTGYNRRKEIWRTLKDGGADVGKSFEEFKQWWGYTARQKPQDSSPQGGKGFLRSLLGNAKAIMEPVDNVAVTAAKAKRQVEDATAQAKTAKQGTLQYDAVGRINEYVGNLFKSSIQEPSPMENLLKFGGRTAEEQAQIRQRDAEQKAEAKKERERQEREAYYKQLQDNAVKAYAGKGPHFDKETGILVTPEMEWAARIHDMATGAYQRKQQAEKSINEYVGELDKELSDFEERHSKDLYGSRLSRLMGEAALSFESPAIGAKGRMDYILRDRSNENSINDEADRLRQSRRLLSGALDVIKASKEGSGFVRGLYDTAKQGSTWDFGFTDMIDAAQILAAVEKFENNKELTKGEESLLKSAAIAAYVGGAYDLSRAYNMGTTTAASVPFIIETILSSGMSGAVSAAAKAAVKAATKAATKKVTKKVVKNKVDDVIADAAKEKLSKAVLDKVGKVAKGTASAALQGAVQTGTVGLGHVAAGTAERMTGDIKPDINENGEVVYGGRENAETLSSAFGKSFTSDAIERMSELLGDNVLEPGLSLLGRAATSGKGSVASWMSANLPNLTKSGKYTLAKGKKLLDTIAPEKLRKAWNYTSELRRRAHIQGIVPEYLEELTGSIADATLVGDQKWVGEDGKMFGSSDPSAIFNYETQLDTALGLLPMQIFFGATNMVSFARMRHKAPTLLSDADNKARGVFGGNWDIWKDVVDNSSDKDLARQITTAIKIGSMTQEQASALQGYAAAKVAFDSVQLASEKEDRETGDSSNISKAFNIGYQLTDEQNRNSIEQDYAASQEDGYEGDALLAQARYMGMKQREADDKRNLMLSRAGKDGKVHPAKLARFDSDTKAYAQDDVYIIDGNVVLNNDGTVDQEETDDMLIVVDNSGNRHTIFKGDIDSVGEVEDIPSEGEINAPAEALQEALQEKENSEYADTENVVEGKSLGGEDKTDEAEGNGGQMPGVDKVGAPLAFAKGDVYAVKSGEDVMRLEVVGRDKDNDVVVRDVATGEEATYPEGVLQSLVDDYRREQVQQNLAGQTDTQAGQQVQPVEETTETPLPKGANEGDGTVEYKHEDLANGSSRTTIKGGGGTQIITDGNVQSQQSVAAPIEQQAEAAPKQVQEPMPVRKDGSPDFVAAGAERTHKFLSEESGMSGTMARNFAKANAEKAQKDIDDADKKLRKLEENPGTDFAGLRKKIADLQARKEQAQQSLEFWNGVKGEQDKAEVARREEQRKRDAEHQAVMDADEQAYLEEEAAKAAERKARGINAAGEAVRGKWDAAPKIEGAENEIILANGEKVAGRYVLVESGAATPSHNAANGFSKSDGFPFDENGQSVNDRDYERDQNAQDVTRQMAAQYDGRAVQDVPVVSREGVVLSGNGRTMAGELAARNGTDASYVEHLKKHPQQFGFTPEQVEGMEHPRVVFVPDADMPYTAETFAKFNAQSMKSQSKTEQAVKLGKTVDDGTFNRIIRSMNAYDTIGDFYNDATAAGNAIAELQKAGVINQMQYAEMFDGEKVSEAGRQMLENMLIGKAFESNPDAVRQLTEIPSLRQSVISALAEISNNVGLGGEYSLEQEIADAIDLAYRARKAGTKAGDPVSEFARQGELFGEETVADYKNATVMMLADTLNDNRQSQLKKVLALYNRAAEDSASGQMELFGGGVKNKEDIINDVLEILNYDTERLQSELDAARAQRKAAAGQGGGSESVQQDGTAGESNSGSEDTGRSERSEAPVENEAVEAAVGGEESATTDEESRKSFATVFTQFKGKAKEAIDYILGRKTGRAIAALHHKDVGDIDLWYGNDKAGLKKIAQKHPEVLGDLQGIIDGMRVVKSSDNRIILESDTHIAVVSKMLGSEKTDNWLLSAYEKKEASGGSSDIVPEPERGKQNGTAPLQSTPSAGKGSASSADGKENGGENAGEIIENFDIDSTAYEEVENEVALLPVSIRERIDDAVRKLQKERRKQALEDEASRFTFKKIQEAGGTLSNYTKEELDKNYLLTGDAYPLHWLEFRIEPSKKKGRYNLTVSRKYDKDLPVSALSYNPFKYTTDEDLTPKEIDAKTKEWVMSNSAIGNKVSLAEYKQIVERETKATVKDGEATEQSAEPAPVETTGPQPIGKGVFGNIYDQFKGKVKEAFEFLIKHKSGDLLGVFHRDGFGDIDLVWGDKGGGAEHIIDKHVGEGKSFATEEEAFTEIDRIIKTGKKDFEDGDKVVFKDGNKSVTVRKNWREKGKKIADKNWVLTAYDEMSADSESPVATNEGLAGLATDISADKGTNLFGNEQVKGKKSSSEVADVVIKGDKWKNTKSPARNKRRGGRDFYDVSYQIGDKKTRYGMTKADSDLLHVLLGDYHDNLKAIWNAYERGQVLIPEDVASAVKAMIEYEEESGKSAGVSSRTWYQKVGDGSFVPTENDGVFVETMAEDLNAMGVETYADAETGQRMLDETNGRGVLQRKLDALHEAERFIEGSLQGKHPGKRVRIELPSSTLRKVHDAMGRDFDSHNIFANGIVHSKNNHGVGGKKLDVNSIPLRDEDFQLAPYIMTAPDRVVRGSFSSDGRESVRFEKDLSNGVVLVVEKEQKISPNDMDTITMWADKSSRGADARPYGRPLHTTSETVISSFDAAKIRKDAETAIASDGKIRKHKASPVFYSNAEKAVEGLKQEKATPAQWLAMLQKQGGLKAAEDKWLGLSEWLESSDAKTLTKQEVLDFIRENEVQLEEVAYAEKPKGFEELQAEYDGWLRNGGYDYAWEQLRERFGDDADIAFSDFGGELVIDNGEAAEALLGSERAINETRLGYTTEGLENKREVAITVPSVEPYNENDEIHFGDADGGRAVVWVRFGETTDADGKRVLVIDEIQSKRHQDGREIGYKQNVIVKGRVGNYLEVTKKLAYADVTKEDGIRIGQIMRQDGKYIALDQRMQRIDFNRYNTESEALAKVEEDYGIDHIRIPDAPFEKNWHELAMKRMLRLAAEEGFDKVAWTTGAQQAERYSIGDVVEKIVSYNYPAAKDAEGRESRKVEIRLTSGDVMTMRVNAEGRVIEGRGDTEGKELSDVVGKDLARRIMEGEGRDGSIFDAERDIPAKVIEGDGLLIGGDGMRGFYDQMLPRFMDKYGKKWGVKTGDVVLPELEGLAQRMHAVDVTPEMKASVMEGQPMFFRTADGEAYGFTVDGRIYIDPRIATRETPLHEYDHLWSEALEKANPEAWAHLKERLREKEDLLAYVKGLYPEIEDENELLHEVFSHFAGRRGAERLKEMEHAEVAKTRGVLNKARVVDMFRRLRDMLREYWTMARNLFAGNNAKLKGMSAEDFADMAMSDFVRGFNPGREMSEREANPHKDAQLRLVVGRNAMEDDYHVGIRSIDDIKTYEEAVREGEGLDSYPDFTREDAERALQEGEITVYSSKPIEQGGFVSTSRMEAKEYAGGGRIYEKRVSLDDVAWIYASEGQYAKVDEAAADIRFHKAVGGNRGYVGYSMSRRAAEARSEGRYPKTDFKKEYGLTEKAFKGLEQAGVIGSSEWHHTSKYGNKTAFYSWSEPWMADAYAERKKDVDAALKEYATAMSEYKAMSSTFWNDYVELRSSDREAAEALSEKKDVLKEAVREKKFAVEKIFDDWHAVREGEDVEVSSEPVAELTERIAGESLLDYAGRVDAAARKKAAHEHIDSMASRYGTKGHCISQAIHDEADLAELKKVLDTETYERVERYFHDAETGGVYMPSRELAVIFTGKFESAEAAELSWWHEQTHHAYKYMPAEMQERYGKAAMEYLEKEYPEVAEHIKDKYEEKYWQEEAVAYFAEETIRKHGAKKYLSSHFEGNADIANLAAEIQKSLKYGKERENSDKLRRNAETGKEGQLAGDADRLQLYESGGRGEGAQSGESERSESDGDTGRLNSDAADDAAELAAYDAGRMSLAERAAQAVAAMSAKNRADVEARREAVKALGGNLQKLRQAMARQREYDKGTVDAIVRQARIMLEGGMLDGMTRGEVKKLLSLVNKAAGREDITRQADGVVELMAKHLVRQGKATMESLLKTRDKKVNSKGVEAQGRLDVAGQRMIDAFREALPLDEESLAGWIADCEDRMGSEDSVTVRNAEAEHEGLMLAKRHLEEIKASEAEEAELRHELKQAEEKVHGGDYSSFGSKEAYREYVRETEAAIRENLLERVEAYGRLNQQFGGSLVGSAARAKAFREAEKQRVREIQHNANSDLEGMPANEHGKIKKTFRDWDLVRLFMKPLATFNTMLRYFGGKSVDGRGYLFNRFMPQWQKAFDGEHAGLRAAHKELDAKVSEVMGRKMRWSDLFSLEREMDKNLGGGTEVEFMDDGKKRTMKLTQGNLLYIYMVNKMADGRMKLRGMGITEDIVEAIKSEIDPRFIEIADWIQDEFLVKKREEYNAVHERMFGASMAAIEDYFPLKINSRSRGKSEDVGSMESDEIMPGTIAGSIKKRTRNGLALDITGADAFDVVLEHLQEMEHWAHFAELNRDLNTLLSYKKFKNRVLGMKSLRYGGGEKIWQNFRDTCRIVAGTYRQSVTPDSADKFVTNVAKGVTGAKISFRIFTALKQLLSYPAYLSNASIVELAKSSNPVGMVKSWNWAIENLPGFAQRWQSRQAGDTRLMDTASDWSIWHSKVVEKATRWGMTPNAFVDGMTVAMGAKAIYETKLKGYKKAGYSDAAAEKKALEDASIAYNETQQSSASAYTSAMQLDRTVASTMLTVFRNASMGYQRKYFGALANLKRKMRKGYKDESIAFMAKQVQREWNGTDDVKDEDVSQEAKDYAKRLYYKSYYKDLADTVIFGWVLQFAWNLGPYLPYLLMGDDDDEKDAMLEDAAMHALAGGVEGLSGGNVMSDLYNLKRSGEKIGTYNFNLMPLMSDLQTTLKHFDNDAVSGMTDLVNLAVQSGFGFNPQTATDGIVALLDACEGDMGTAKEAGLFAMRVLQFPQSGLDKMLIDELGIGKDDVAHADFMDIATRYARYKRRRQAPLLGWMYSDEEKATKEKKKISGPYSFSEKVKERIVRLNDERVLGLVKRNDDKLSELAEKELQGRVANYSDEQMNDIFEGSDDVMRKLAGKEVAKRIGGQDSYGSPKTEYGRVYEKKRKMFDVAEDVLLQTAKKKAKESGDEELEEAIEKGQRELTKIKKGDKKHYGLGELSDEEDDVIMEALRTRRKEIIRELRIK